MPKRIFKTGADPKKNPTRNMQTAFWNGLIPRSLNCWIDRPLPSRGSISKSFYDIEAIGKFPERSKPHSVYPEIDLNNRFPSYDRLNNQILQYKLSVVNPSAQHM